MNEWQWLLCDAPGPMLGFLRDKASDRKLRLFACACCRRIWHLLPDKANQDLVAAVEDCPDGTFDESDPDLYQAICASSRREEECRHDSGYWAVKYLGRSYYKFKPCESVVAVALHVIQRVRTAGDAAAEQAAQAELVRDLFGNPFRPAAISHTWRKWNEATVIRVAQTASDERILPAGTLDNTRLLILADALEEAGCTDEQILTHLRGGGEHYRGCWVIDLLLGKS